MNFFLPLADDAEESEYLWEGTRMLLEEDGYPTLPRRIQALAFYRGDEARFVQVGLEDSETGEPVILILQASNAPFYYVCSASYGLMDGAPMPIPAREGTHVIYFDRG